MVSVTIIILTYNSSLFITNLLKSLGDFAKDSEIIVVDNASSDDTVNKVKKLNDKIKVIETGKNLGFAKGINTGVDSSKSDYSLFINPDAVFKDGKLADMTRIFEENQKAGVVGGKLVNRNGHPEKSAGKFFGLIETLLIVLGLDEHFSVRFSPDKISRVDFVSGGFMMVRSELFKKLNGFDESFFMYMEDMEFCFRAKKEGFETFFTPHVSLMHIGQGSSNRGFAVYNIYRGILYFFKKHKGNLEYETVRTALRLKSLTVYFLGKITHNSYYTSTYEKTFDLFR